MSDARQHSGHSEGEVNIDVRERGLPRDGVPQFMDRRLFMQLLVFDVSEEISVEDAERGLAEAVTARGIEAVIYADANAPRGVGLLTWSEAPEDFVDKVRPAVNEVPGLAPRPAFTMLGRAYSNGYEDDLAFWMLERPRATVLNEGWNWHVWYPLRRNGAFARLEPREQGAVLREHGTIGKAYGQTDLAHDIRLACHGLDAADNEFLIGLVGKDLHPLSHVVQTMRRTRQTSEFISQMGPFFVGRAIWRNARAT
jgi:chlorite dismutase